jgi:chromosome segregation ATPase
VELVEAGRALLEERRGTAAKATLDRLASTLRAASADERARELLARGRLPDDVDPAGFEALEPMAELLGKGGGAREKRREREQLETTLREARERERELAREADRLERDAAKARKKVEEAAAEVAEAKRRLDEAD